MTKYATLRKYQPYIDIIRKDLGIPDDIYIRFTFGTYTKMGGDSYLYSGKYYGEIRLDKRGSHNWIVRSLMHELRHIWQYYHDLLKDYSGKTALWKGIKYRNRDCNRELELYLQLPWEIDAREYEKSAQRLFPGYKLPVISNRILIAETKTMKLYRERP